MIPGTGAGVVECTDDFLQPKQAIQKTIETNNKFGLNLGAIKVYIIQSERLNNLEQL